MYELGAASLTIAAGCTVEGLAVEKALENLDRAFPTILREFPALRLRFETVDGGEKYWAFCHPSELSFADLVSQVDAPDITPPTALPLEEERPLWRVRVSSSSSSSLSASSPPSAHIRLFVSHSFCDGRTAFDLLCLFVHFATYTDVSAALPSVPEPFRSEWERRTQLGTLESAVLEGTPYGKREWFTPETTTNMRGTPASWGRTVPYRLTPTVPVPSYSVATQWDFPYEPVAAFCRKHDVTVQGIVGAVHAHAMRIFNNAELKEICVCTPTDTRRYPFTTEEHRKSAFFGHNGFVLVFVPQQKTLFEEIVASTKELHKVLKTTEAAHTVMFQAGYCTPPAPPAAAEEKVEEEERDAVVAAPFPDCATRNVVCASHVGRVCSGLKVCELSFMMNNPVAAEGGYWPSLYAFHTDNVLSFSLLHPYNAPSAFVEAVHSTIKEAMDLCSN